MEKVFESVCTQVPSLSVLVVVVYFFLKAQKDTRDSNIAERKELADRIGDNHKEHMNARVEMVAVLEKVATSMHEVSLAVATCPLKHSKQHL